MLPVTNRDYVVSMPSTDVSTLARIRMLPNVFVFAENDNVWVWGKSADTVARSALQSLPGKHFFLTAPRSLTPIGCFLATEELPASDWVPLNTWLEVELPTSHWTGSVDERTRLSLVPSDAMTVADGLLTTIDELLKLIEQASFRFQHLRFAMNDLRQAFVVGRPLPAIPGIRFCIHEDIAVPAGQHWSPAIDATTIRSVFGRLNGIVLWQKSEHWEVVPHDAFVNVSRSAVRESASHEGDSLSVMK